MTRPPPKWDIRTFDRDLADKLARETGVPMVIAKILVHREVLESNQVLEFLEPRLANLKSPNLFRDMDRAVSRTVQAIEQGESVCIHGDYDADGMTSTTLLHEFLSSCGLPTTLFVPDRAEDGYGLNASRVEEFARAGTQLMITVDCGVKSIDEIEIANSLGMDVIVLDHHEPASRLPPAVAIVNPHRADCDFPFKDLAAVGVSFYFAGAVRRALIEREHEFAVAIDLKKLLDLVALGTVADVVPLLGDNRVLTAAGLKVINDNPRVGITALKAVANSIGREVTAGTIGFQLAPRLNATGRLSNPRASLDLLMSRNPEEAKRWADVLNRENDQRREIERSVSDQALAVIEGRGGPAHRAIVVAGDGWHAGVVGIVASRLTETYTRPSIVLSIEGAETKGSCRSVRGFDIGAALDQFDHILTRHGGHPMAAGLALKTERVQEFIEAFEQYADAHVSEDLLTPRMRIDAEVAPGELNPALLSYIKMLQPFGMGNPEPVFALFGVELATTRRVGQDLAHLQMTVKSQDWTVDGIWFRAPAMDTVGSGKVDIAFSLMLDDKVPKLKVRDVRPAGEG